jgi:hypothetical protein
MSDSSRVQLLYLPESGFAAPPSANPPSQLVRFTKSTFSHKNTTVVSEEIRSDRQRSNLALVGFDCSGDFTIEPSYGHKAFEDFLEAALCGSWTADVLENGTTNRSFLVEQGFLDIGKYIDFAGMTVDKFSLDASSLKIVQGVITFMGSAGVAGSASIAGTTTPTDDSTNEPMHSGDLIAMEAEGGGNFEVNDMAVKSVKIDIANNLRRHDLVTQYASDDFGRGVMDITGSMETYFKDIAAFNQFVVNGLFALKFKMTSPNMPAVANTYEFTLPRLFVTDAPLPIPGVDSDIMQVLTFRATLDAGVGYTIHVERNITT